ncbi:unnamed protein product [Peniophora sp. CBMAI 1063]|nr:unnamed protein product [Peniophora sp. CBMAI 1063]
MSSSAAPKGVLLKSDAIASKFTEEVKSTLASRSRKPKLVGILSTGSAPSRSYAEFTRKQCEALGVEFQLKETGAALDQDAPDGEGVEDAIIEANGDSSVDGIMVYYPIFGAQQDHYLQQVVSPYKDVEGLNFKFHYNLYHNIRYLDPKSLISSAPLVNPPAPTTSDVPPPGTVKCILPCTPLGIVKALEGVGVYNTILPYGDRAYGKTVTVINRSEVVGRPLAALLANDGARVYSVDIDSIQVYTKRPPAPDGTDAGRYHPHHVVRPTKLSLEECLSQSDVVVSAVPSDKYKVKTSALKEGCVCINVAADKNFEANVREKASLYLPTVGKLTILMLLRNLLRLQEYQSLLESTTEPKP